MWPAIAWLTGHKDAGIGRRAKPEWRQMFDRPTKLSTNLEPFGKSTGGAPRHSYPSAWVEKEPRIAPHAPWTESACPPPCPNDRIVVAKPRQIQNAPPRLTTTIGACPRNKRWGERGAQMSRHTKTDTVISTKSTCARDQRTWSCPLIGQESPCQGALARVLPIYDDDTEATCLSSSG